MKSILKGIHLSERDIQLLNYLHAVKVATYDQIARDLYEEYSLESVGNRLRKLEDNRLIRAERCRSILKGKRLVSITKHGFEEFVKMGGEMIVELKSDAIHHDLVLVDIRHKILKSPKTTAYQTENEIQTWEPELRKLNCDALVTSNLGKSTFLIPVEYEASLKKAERYEPMVRKYYQATEFPLVAFIADSPAILKKVKHTEEQLFNWDKPKFFYRLAADFLIDEALRLENCNKASLSLGHHVAGG